MDLKENGQVTDDQGRVKHIVETAPARPEISFSSWMDGSDRPDRSEECSQSSGSLQSTDRVSAQQPNPYAQQTAIYSSMDQPAPLICLWSSRRNPYFVTRFWRKALQYASVVNWTCQVRVTRGPY